MKDNDLIFIAFGSNQSDPLTQLITARYHLANNEFLCEQAASSLYQTPPVGYAAQDDFVNAVVAYTTDLPPKQLLSLLLQTEKTMGRVRNIKNGPRIIDLDLLLYKNINFADDELTLPHAAMHERAFALVPLLEIVDDINVGKHGSARDCLAMLPKYNFIRLEEKKWQLH